MLVTYNDVGVEMSISGPFILAQEINLLTNQIFRFGRIINMFKLGLV